MKKKKKSKLTAAGFTAGVLLGSAAFLPGCNFAESVYGPPPDVEQEYSSTPSPTPRLTVTAIPSFDPENDIAETVYGPPSYFEEEGPETPEYDPEKDGPEEVYGPPEWFE